MTDSTDSPGTSEDLKRKFREALDRKNAHHTKSEAHLAARAKASPAHAAAGHKREFRRKSA